MEFERVAEYLKKYDGRELRLMEVCGTHTAEIRRNGIPSLLSDKIRLITGPGCPVCVTVSGYIDKLIELSRNKQNVIVSFGDLLRVRGSEMTLTQARAKGADVRYVYSPLEALRLAAKESTRMFIFAAVGFETTAPIYAALLSQAEEEGVNNVKLLTSLKTMPQAIRKVADGIDGFLAPGHVAVITGTREYEELAAELATPFAVSGFKGRELMAAIYALVRMAEGGKDKCVNLYPQAVKDHGNKDARRAVERFFRTSGAAWRGMGVIPDSGLCLRDEYGKYDAGSGYIVDDVLPDGCRCAEVITGKLSSEKCPLFGHACTPDHPIGACMVSQEGACFSAYM